ncbi:MAG TPA: hypothetical protein PK876_04160 [Elusimicrobiota bacterium]|nr:hypothetical protein [Elusimicrobiota bacterium]
MQPVYKHKKRKAAGPNKNEKKVMREMEAERRIGMAGTLKERYPSVQRLTIQLNFISPQGHLLEQQTRHYGPADACDFSATCLGRCGGTGSFDLESKIKEVISTRRAASDNTGTCQEKLYPGSADCCGSRLQCKIEVSYQPGN